MTEAGELPKPIQPVIEYKGKPASDAPFDIKLDGPGVAIIGKEYFSIGDEAMANLKLTIDYETPRGDYIDPLDTMRFDGSFCFNVPTFYGVMVSSRIDHWNRYLPDADEGKITQRPTREELLKTELVKELAIYLGFTSGFLSLPQSTNPTEVLRHALTDIPENPKSLERWEIEDKLWSAVDVELIPAM